MKTLHLIIYSPFGKYFDEEVEYISAHSTDYLLGILPGHAPLISTLAISILEIKRAGKDYKYAIGGGVINIDEEKVTLMVESIESGDELDVERIKLAKQRAEERLKLDREKFSIDVKRAEAALRRANNRLSLIESMHSKD